ncbi:pyridoxal phosphate-dependent aminotransferase [Clostridium sp. 'White wine YQ']|uniref:pyridoxal phosphate-dependent aminotransferase n=1 Tax=Clostridium sp. 'White wine YQ' TaxID=3027474 RepID=UPI002365514F|nr:pyridoxal phosphate-dependent aminotransferase [Clostridium sp. 'White wine YQ']MDD7793815.1 pyridoxal phosphate-dependent aminotransferase [Clostridium sp. 'White wine YQ']
MILSKKGEAISPSITLAITAKAKEMKANGIDVVSFGAGEPDFNTPKNIRDAAVRAMEEGFTKYTPAAGITNLKKAIATKLYKDNNLTYDESQIIISTGAKQCLANAFLAILNPGDEVLIPTPYWVSYPELTKLADGVPVFIDCKKEDNYKFKVSILEKYITEKTKAILINSPNNPTGTIYTREELKELADFAAAHNLFIISDEIYEKLIYGSEEHVSIASLSKDAYERTIVINGMSKSYSMTGWRVGYAAGPKEVIKVMSNIQSHMTSNVCSISQYAALEALEGPQDDLYSMIKVFQERRDLMSSMLDKMDDISYIYPQGAFYIMVNIESFIGKSYKGKTITDSLTFSNILLDETKVAVVPGAGFGLENYIRLSYATSNSIIEEGLKRLSLFVSLIK